MNTATDIKPIEAGNLVVMGATSKRPMHITVLHESILRSDLVDQTLANEGWRYAEYFNTGYRVLIRPTGRTKLLKAWHSNVQEVEVRRVDTLVHEAGDSFAIVAGLGETVTKKAVSRLPGGIIHA